MKREQYLRLVVDQFGERYTSIMKHSGWNYVDLVKHIAERLFMENITEGELVDETRKQLIHLSEYGTHLFE